MVYQFYIIIQDGGSQTKGEDWLNQIDRHCSELFRREPPSEHKMKDFFHMSNFSWDKLISEMSDRCPVLLDALLAATGYSKDEINSVSPRIGLCYAILLQMRNHELSLLQRLNTVLMTNGNAKKQVISYTIIVTDCNIQ